jgi:hypothetical protein
MQWNDLATDVQRELFDSATSMGQLRHVPELKGRIARFLRKHKDGTATKGSVHAARKCDDGSDD